MHLKKLSLLYRRLIADFSHAAKLNQKHSPAAPSDADADKLQTNEQLASELETARTRLRENNALVFQLKEEKIALGIHMKDGCCFLSATELKIPRRL